MIRAFFLAIGLCIVIAGLECLVVEKAYLYEQFQVRAGNFFSDPQFGRKEIVPPPWAPFTLIAAGVVVLLYSFSIAKRVRG